MTQTARFKTDEEEKQLMISRSFNYHLAYLIIKILFIALALSTSIGLVTLGYTGNSIFGKLKDNDSVKLLILSLVLTSGVYGFWKLVSKQAVRIKKLLPARRKNETMELTNNRLVYRFKAGDTEYIYRTGMANIIRGIYNKESKELFLYGNILINKYNDIYGVDANNITKLKINNYFDNNFIENVERLATIRTVENKKEMIKTNIKYHLDDMFRKN